MKRFLPPILVASLVLLGCKTAEKSAGDEEFSFREMRKQTIQQMRAAGASSAQIREMERQLDVMERQMKQMQRQMEKMEAVEE